MKTPMSWIDVTTMVIKDRKAKGLEPGLKPAIPEAKKVWAEIKKGSHPKYMVGKPKFKKSKGKKTAKKSKKNAEVEENVEENVEVKTKKVSHKKRKGSKTKKAKKSKKVKKSKKSKRKSSKKK